MPNLRPIISIISVIVVLTVSIQAMAQRNIGCGMALRRLKGEIGM